VSATIEHKIPDELIINVDQTPSKYVPTENVTMTEKNSKHIPRKEGNYKRAITATLSETLSGTILPFQLIYQGKTCRSLPAVKLPADFSLSYNTKHWSNEVETIRLLNDIIAPYITKVKEELGLPENQSTLLLWDAFKAQSIKKSIRELEKLAIKHVKAHTDRTRFGNATRIFSFQ
jgi:hypothetical protein